ncbi:MAG TPA: alpha/beta fold hydrolase [Polyangia bacterium]|nr:alpha/beta fold hydrolase [Polyangia bacterium]
MNRRAEGHLSRRLAVWAGVVTLLSSCMPPSWAANALLHPPRRPVTQVPAAKFEKVDLDVGIHLAGWLFRTERPRRGLVVYLHGVGDNRASGIGIAAHFTALGFDVLAYDSRAHGESGGDACTYGFYEKRDLSRALDQMAPGPVLAFGISLGAGVALQAAAEDPRIALVVAVSTYSDLRTVASERAPFFASRGNIAEAFRIAEAEAAFRADEVSPAAAAAKIHAPVLVIHGADDHETPPAHSERVYRALAGPKKLVLVPGAHHNDALTADAWKQIDGWIASNWPG